MKDEGDRVFICMFISWVMPIPYIAYLIKIGVLVTLNSQTYLAVSQSYIKNAIILIPSISIVSFAILFCFLSWLHNFKQSKMLKREIRRQNIERTRLENKKRAIREHRLKLEQKRVAEERLRAALVQKRAREEAQARRRAEAEAGLARLISAQPSARRLRHEDGY